MRETQESADETDERADKLPPKREMEFCPLYIAMNAAMARADVASLTSAHYSVA